VWDAELLPPHSAKRRSNAAAVSGSHCRSDIRRNPHVTDTPADAGTSGDGTRPTP
jgi:hypothetical protein